MDAEAACSVVVQVIGGEVREELRPLPKEYNNSLLLRCGVVEAVGRQLAIEAKHYAETIKVGQRGVLTGGKGHAWVVWVERAPSVNLVAQEASLSETQTVLD